MGTKTVVTMTTAYSSQFTVIQDMPDSRKEIEKKTNQWRCHWTLTGLILLLIAVGSDGRCDVIRIVTHIIIAYIVSIITIYTLRNHAHVHWCTLRALQKLSTPPENGLLNPKAVKRHLVRQLGREGESEEEEEEEEEEKEMKTTITEDFHISKKRSAIVFYWKRYNLRRRRIIRKPKYRLDCIGCK
ncbi:uncharacterized protein LOC144350261 [Saccoglossus kowalevskii]